MTTDEQTPEKTPDQANEQTANTAAPAAIIPASDKPTEKQTDKPAAKPTETAPAKAKGKGKDAKALTDIAYQFKKTGSISGPLAKKLNTLVPDLTERIKANATKASNVEKVETKAPAKPSTKTAANAAKVAPKKDPKKAAPKAPKAAKTPKPAAMPVKAEPIAKRPTNGKYPLHPKNPFREGSSYALAFDILAANRKGMNRADLTKEYSRVSKKPLKNAGYDIAVLLSPKSEKPTSERHKSCRDGFGIRKENAFVQIILPGKD